MHLLYPALVEYGFSCLHLCKTCCSVAVSFCLSLSGIALLWQVSQRFLFLHRGLSVSLLVSLFLQCHSILSWLSWLCADLRLPLQVSVRSSLFPSPSALLDALRMWQKSCEPLYLCISCLSLACCFFLFVFFFLLEWCWMWKSCTCEHSGEWTSCTCEHKTAGNTVTSRFFFSSVVFFSADVSQILKKFEKLAQGT